MGRDGDDTQMSGSVDWFCPQSGKDMSRKEQF